MPLTNDQQEMLLQYCRNLTDLQFDKARTLIEQKLKTIASGTPSKSSGGSASSSANSLHKSEWSILLTSLATLSVAEKAYYSLGFVQSKKRFSITKPSTITNSTSLRTQYMLAHSELGQVAMPDTSSTSRNTTEAPSVIGHIGLQIQSYCNARIELIDAYGNWLGQVKSPIISQNIQTLINSLNSLKLRYGDSTHHPLISMLQERLVCELDTFSHLLKAANSLSNLAILETLVNMRNARILLTQFLKERFSNSDRKMIADTKPIRSWLPFLRKTRDFLPTGMASLCTFLNRLYDFLVHKFTLYAFEFLVQQSSMQEMRQQMTSIVIDADLHIYNSLHQLYKKQNAVCIAFIHDGSNERRSDSCISCDLDIVQTSTSEESLHMSGLDLYSVLFALPSERPSPLVNQSLMPAIVMLICTHSDAFRKKPDMVAVDVDVGKSRTILLSWIEQNVYVVFVLQGAQLPSEKRDANIASLGRIVKTLRLQSVIQS